MVNDQVQIRTSVADFRRAFSRRKYEFVRQADQAVLARGETNWVFLDIATSRPKSIPPHIAAMFELLPDEQKP